LVCFSRFSLFAFRFSRFSLFARARARKQMHMYTLKERERERAENEKSKKERVANEREVARADSAQVPRPFALSTRQSRSSTFKINLKINRSIDQSINRSIGKIENSVLPQCFSRSLLLPPSSPLAPASPVADSDGHLPAETKKNQQFKK
jgi:hypothetical protein